MSTSQMLSSPSQVASWSSSEMRVVKFEHKWTINNFSLCSQKTGQRLQSAKFSADANDTRKWYIILYPNGDRSEAKDYVSLYLDVVSYDKRKVRATSTFSVLEGNGAKYTLGENAPPKIFLPGRGGGFGYPQFIRRDEILDKTKSYLPDDTLTILCKVVIFEDRVITFGKCQDVVVKVRDCELGNELGKLLENQQLTDVTLCVSGREFPAHKAILAARSPVFAAMFVHKMEERVSNRVNISDVDHQVLGEMLRFIYTGKAENLKEMASDLLTAADKYGLERLKEMCMEALYNNVTVKTVVNILVLADLHRVAQLKTQAIKFINANTADVVKSSGWQSLTVSHPQLITEVFLASRRNPSNN